MAIASRTVKGVTTSSTREAMRVDLETTAGKNEGGPPTLGSPVR